MEIWKNLHTLFGGKMFHFNEQVKRKKVGEKKKVIKTRRWLCPVPLSQDWKHHQAPQQIVVVMDFLGVFLHIGLE